MLLRPIFPAIATALATMSVVSSAAAEDPPNAPWVTPGPGRVVAPRTLHAQRFEIEPSVAYAFTPSSISHIGIGGGLAYYLTDSLAIGVDGLYWLSESAPAPNTATWPLRQTLWNADLDFTYVVLSSEHWNYLPDIYLTAGIGALATHPIAVVDVARTFPDATKLDIVVGLGLRRFVTHFLAFSFEMRDLIYVDRLENPLVGTSPGDPADAFGPMRLTNSVQGKLGMSFWFPIL